MSEKKTIVDILLLLSYFVIMWGVLGYVLRPFYFSLIVLAVLVFKKNYSYNSRFISFLFFLIICLLDSLFGDDFIIGNMVFKRVFLFIIVVISQYYLLNSGLNNWKSIAYQSSLFLFIPIIISLAIAIFFPNLLCVRNKENSVSDIWSMIQINYTMAHTLPCFIPCLICAAKLNHGTVKIILIAVAVALLLLLLKASVTTSFFLGLFVFILSLIANLNKYSIATTCIISAIFIIILNNSDYLFGALDYFAKISGSTIFSEKIDDMRLVALGDAADGNQVVGRMQLYANSWKTFFHHPFGVWSQNGTLGGHSCIADMFAYFGVIPTYLFLSFLYKQCKAPSKLINQSIKYFYILSYIPLIGLIILKGRGVVLSVEMLLVTTIIVPGLFIYIQDKYFSEVNENSSLTSI